MMYALQKLKNEIESKVPNAKITEPPKPEMGDLSFFSKDKIDLSGIKGIKEVKVMGPYHNVFIDYDHFSKEVLNEASKNDYGKGKENEKILIEYTSPNTNKPLHIGHVRNVTLAMAVSNILEHNGNKINRVNWVNDRGIHICKSMLAYQKFGNEKTPEEEGLKPDFFVGKYYVMFGKEAEKNLELNERAQELLRKWESGDKETRKLWKKMNSWAYKGWEYTINKLGCEYDKWYYESDVYKQGKKVVEKGLEKGVFKKDETGAVYADLEKYNLPNKIILRSDGTSLYVVPDLYLGELKYKDFKMDESIYCVGSAQELYFKQLFKILELIANSEYNLHHLSYGMVSLPEGKMSSRKGRSVYADDVIQEVEEKARIEIEKRGNADNVEKTAEQIGLGALKFSMLNIDAKKDIVFDKEKSVSFTGDTGPYLQYAHVRCASILEKEKPKNGEIKLLKDEEKQLVKKLSEFPGVVEKAGNDYTTHKLANYLLELAHQYSSFYENCPVLEGKNKNTRLKIVMAVKNTLKIGLNLLGIEAPEKM